MLPQNEMNLDFSAEILLVNDVDALVRQLALRMTGSSLNPRSFQIIQEAVLKITTNDYDWQNQRVYMAAYLIGASVDFNIQK